MADIGATACHWFYGEVTRRSFDERIGSRYDEISGLDRPVPNWNAPRSAALFFAVFRKF
jgi:hypothetical protein